MTEHECLFTGRGCNSGHEEGGEVQPALTDKPAALCPGCLKSVERAADESVETFVRLHAAIGDKNMRRGQRVSGTKNPPVPVNVDVAAAMDRMVEWLTVGALRLADLMGMDEPVEPESRITSEHARVVGKCCKILRPNTERLIESVEDTVTVWRKTGESTTFRDMSGADIAWEIVRANRWGRKLLDPGEKQDFACPLCRARAVYRLVYWTSGGQHRDLVECHNCGKGWEYESYQTICNVALRAIEEERVTEEERLAAWCAAEKLWHEAVGARMQASALEERLAEVRRIADLEATGFDVTTLQAYLREVLEAA